MAARADIPGSRLELAPGVWAPAEAVSFTFSAGSGPGGQNVNKRATRAELRIRIADLPIPADAKERLAAFAGSRATAAGDLIIAAGEHRSQERNKSEALARLRDLLVRSLVRPKKRRPTRPGRGAVERRLAAKRREGERKRGRRAGGED